MSDTHYKVSELKELGWTDGLIKKYLGNPDKLVTNPVFKSQPAMRLYEINRVEQITEQHQLEPTLESNLEKRVKRSQSALAVADSKRQKMLDWVRGLNIKIPKYEYEHLIDLACDHYNDLQVDRRMERGNYDGNFRAADISSDPQFLYRITHNFLRHEQTKYEDTIDLMFGKVGKLEAYELLKARITDEIDKTYPDLMKFIVEFQRSLVC